MQSTSREMLGWRKHKLESRLLREISISPDMQIPYADGESEEELKSLLMNMKEDSETVGLKLNTKIKLRSWHLVPSLHGK